MTLVEKDCCGCEACVNACANQAITMAEDEYGFRYPRIDAEKCTQCGLCVKACGYQNPPELREPNACYAAAAKDQDVLKKSASGGVFAVLTEEILKNAGVVYGVAMADAFQVKHIRITESAKLPLLQGSKYVQSEIGPAYKSAKQDLVGGKEVLFSGTPCQIAGLIRYLGKEYSNLITAEVICHGVPNAKMFQDFIAAQQGDQKKIRAFSFRSKVKGQCETAQWQLSDGRTVYKNAHLLSYTHYFLKSALCRTSCYSCPFAQRKRVADLTLGDYWGFHQEHPRNTSGLSDGKGVSCVLANTQQGQALLDRCKTALVLMETDYDKIARHNMQLVRPCKCPPERDTIMELYRDGGYAAVEMHYKKHCKKDRFIQLIMALFPKGMKRRVKKLLLKLS